MGEFESKAISEAAAKVQKAELAKRQDALLANKNATKSSKTKGK